MTTNGKSDLTSKLRLFLAHESPHIQSRAQIVLLMLEGRSPEEIAAATELSERTVQKWLKAWEADGLAIFPAEDGATGTSTEEVKPDDSPTLILAKALPPPPTKPGVSASDSLAEAARKTLYFQFHQMVLHQAEIDGENSVEGVHKMRVAIRRIRSAYRLFDGILTSDYYGKFPKRLKHTALLLGQVRDLDVFRIKTEAYITTALKDDRTSLTPLLELVEEHHHEALNEVHAWLSDPRFSKFLTRFYGVIESPAPEPMTKVGLPNATQVSHVLPRLIYTQWEAVQRFDSVIDHANATTLHALRIEFKRLRYTLEFFEEVLGPSLKTVIREIKAMQDHLGDLNDAEVAGVLLRDWQKSLKKADRSAVADYRTARETEAAQLKTGTAAAWANFNRPEVHEALAIAIAVL